MIYNNFQKSESRWEIQVGAIGGTRKGKIFLVCAGAVNEIDPDAYSSLGCNANIDLYRLNLDGRDSWHLTLNDAIKAATTVKSSACLSMVEGLKRASQGEKVTYVSRFECQNGQSAIELLGNLTVFYRAGKQSK